MKQGLPKHVSAVIVASFLLPWGSAGAHGNNAKTQVPSAMPAALHGVWHRNDDDGRKDCEAYRKIGSASEITEETGGLVGSLVITGALVHAYSEYGEGNFYLVKRVVGLGNQQWEVDALVGIDSTPGDGEDEGKGMFRFAVASGLLSMDEVGVPDGFAQATNFFRCGKVLDGMYSKQGDTTQ